MLEWVVLSFSRGSSRPRDQTWVSCIAGSYGLTHRHRNRLTDIENRPVVAKRQGRLGEGQIKEVGTSRCKLSFIHTHTYTQTHFAK